MSLNFSVFMVCLRNNEIASYLDGELSDTPAENSFENHLIDCAQCTEKLNAEKRLLHALEAAFDDEKSFEMPVRFAQVVSARAESSVSGLRSKRERRRAFTITLGLFALGFVVGFAGKQSDFLSFMAENLFARIWLIASVFKEFCYGLGLGINIILRVINNYFLTKSPLINFLCAFSLPVAVVILTGILLKFHRVEHSG